MENQILVKIDVDITDIYNEFASTGIEGFELLRQIWNHNHEQYENDLFHIASQGEIKSIPVIDGDGKQYETQRIIELGLTNKEILKRLSITVGSLLELVK